MAGLGSVFLAKGSLASTTIERQKVKLPASLNRALFAQVRKLHASGLLLRRYFQEEKKLRGVVGNISTSHADKQEERRR